MVMGLGSVAANAVGMAGDEPVRIVVPSAPAAPVGGLGSVASMDPSLESAQSQWRDEQWKQQQAAKRPRRGVVYDDALPGAKQQEALNASIRAAQAQGSMGLGSVAAGPTALQSAMGEREGELQGIYGALATPMRQVSVDNWRRPFVEQDAQTFYGGGPLQLEPFIPPPPEAGEDEIGYMQRVQQLQAEDEQRQIAEAQTLGDVRDIGKSGNLGMGEAQLQAAENVGEAEMQQAERVAEVQRQAAETSRAATAEARAADQERRDFARLQRDAIEQAQAVQSDARERLQALPELDPNRTFKSMGGGAKFWAILGSLAGGAIGSNDVPNRLMDIASRDLEAQKANASQVFDAAASADAGVAQQTGLYRDLLGAAGDEAAADAMFLQLQLEDAARELEAQLAETTVPKLKAEIEQSLVGLQQQILTQQRTVDVALATTPEKIVKTFDPLGRRTRDLLMKRAERIEKERFELQKMSIEGEDKQAERDLKLQVEAGKGRAKAQNKVAEQAYAFGKDVEKIDTTIKGIEALTSKDDIPGYGFTASPLPEAVSSGKSDTNAQIDLVLDELARLKSGAAIGQEEWEMYDKMLRGGTTLGGEDRLRRNLERVRTFLVNKRDSLEKGLAPDVRTYYRRNAGLADFEAEWTGGGDAPVVEED